MNAIPVALLRRLPLSIIIACVALASAIGFVAIGAEPITGAFGLKLGDVYPPALTNRSKNHKYSFVPTNGLVGLTVYSVEVVPSTGQVCDISGMGLIPSEEIADKFTLVAKIINDKYGPMTHNSDGLVHTMTVRSGGASVLIIAKIGEQKSGLVLRYFNIGLSEQRIDELKVIESEAARRDLDKKETLIDKSAL